MGLTATPKRKDNVDTYKYFGEPVYNYSLKDGINDGFLTPFKVRQIATTIDDYIYTPDDDRWKGKSCRGSGTRSDFNAIIEIPEREEYRVKLFMEQNQSGPEDARVLRHPRPCAAVRDLINQMKTSKDPNYCVA